MGAHREFLGSGSEPLPARLVVISQAKYAAHNTCGQLGQMSLLALTNFMAITSR